MTVPTHLERLHHDRAPRHPRHHRGRRHRRNLHPSRVGRLRPHPQARVRPHLLRGQRAFASARFAAQTNDGCAEAATTPGTAREAAFLFAHRMLPSPQDPSHCPGQPITLADMAEIAPDESELSSPDDGELRRFFVGLAEGLTAAGESVDRVQSIMQEVAAAYGAPESNFAVLPTMIMVQTGEATDTRVAISSKVRSSLRFDQIAELSTPRPTRTRRRHRSRGGDRRAQRDRRVDAALRLAAARLRPRRAHAGPRPVAVPELAGRGHRLRCWACSSGC